MFAKHADISLFVFVSTKQGTRTHRSIGISSLLILAKKSLARMSMFVKHADISLFVFVSTKQGTRTHRSIGISSLLILANESL